PRQIRASHQVRLPVCPEAIDADVDQPGQLPAQVFDVNAGAAVDVRRVLAGEQGPLPASATLWPLPITTTPLLESVNRCSSRPASTPIRVPGGSSTFLSMMAWRTT